MYGCLRSRKIVWRHVECLILRYRLSPISSQLSTYVKREIYFNWTEPCEETKLFPFLFFRRCFEGNRQEEKRIVPTCRQQNTIVVCGILRPASVTHSGVRGSFAHVYFHVCGDKPRKPEDTKPCQLHINHDKGTCGFQTPVMKIII